MLITGCQHGNNDKTSSNCDSCLVREGDAKDELLPTPITDSLKFAIMLMNKAVPLPSKLVSLVLIHQKVRLKLNLGVKRHPFSPSIN